MITPETIAVLRGLDAAATKGPWVVCGVRGKSADIGDRAVFHDIGPDGVSVAAVWFQKSDGLGFMDAKFLVAMRNHLPTLLDERDALLARVGELEAGPLAEANRRLRLTESSLDCNVEDERFWRGVIMFLEGKM